MYHYNQLHQPCFITYGCKTFLLFQFKQGTWYAVEKFGTKQAKCVTYDFQEDDFGFREVIQHSENTFIERLSFDNNVRYVGKLATISSSTPADMIVRFQLSKLCIYI